jgi:hypothetical protein
MYQKHHLDLIHTVAIVVSLASCWQIFSFSTRAAQSSPLTRLAWTGCGTKQPGSPKRREDWGTGTQSDHAEASPAHRRCDAVADCPAHGAATASPGSCEVGAEVTTCISRLTLAPPAPPFRPPSRRVQNSPRI